MTATIAAGADAMQRSAFLVEMRGVEKRYLRGSEEVHALRAVSLDLRAGQVVALMGPSGSGKTTLLNVLCGWEHPDEGELLWAGAVWPSPAAAPWSDVAILPQDLGLIEDLTVRENVELPLRLAGKLEGAWLDRASGLIEGFGLNDLSGRPPSEVSLGEQQRTALARAFVLRPKLLLADEPTGHQDAQWGKAVLRGIRMAAREGTACLVASHNPEILGYIDRLLAIRDGRIRERRRISR
jgi:putative ABC transport system ATP-binding protein